MQFCLLQNDEDEYKIVGSQEADPFESKISNAIDEVSKNLNYYIPQDSNYKVVKPPFLNEDMSRSDA